MSTETHTKLPSGDPTASAEWNNGCDFAMVQLCKFLGVDPGSVNWDAATETVEGDVEAVIGNILRAKFGENWGNSHTVPRGERKRVFTGIDRTRQIPLLELSPAHLAGTRLWRIWIAYNPDRTEGTYLELHRNGAIWRHTVEPDGSVRTVVITPEETRQ